MFTSRGALAVVFVALAAVLVLVAGGARGRDVDADGSPGHFRDLLGLGGADLGSDLALGAAAEHVEMLDLESFDASLKAHGEAGRIVYVMFFAQWCGACKKFAPHFARVAAAVAADPDYRDRVAFAAFDADCAPAPRKLAERYDAHRGWPTTIAFDRAGPHAAWAEWTDTPVVAEELRNHVEAMLRPDVEILTPAGEGDEDELAAVLERAAKETTAGVTLVGVKLRESEAEVFSKVGRELRRHLTFAAYPDSGVPTPGSAADKILGSARGVHVYRPYAEADGDAAWDVLSLAQELPADALNETLMELALTHKFPLVGDVSTENYKYYIQHGKVPVCYIFATPEQQEQARPWVAALARTTRRRLNFLFGDWEKYQPKLASAFAVPVGAEPPVAVIENQMIKQKWVADTTNSNFQQAVSQLVHDWLADPEAVPNAYVSEPAPDADSLYDSEGVMHVTNSNFDDVVLGDSSRDVFVEFYAPWCGFCSALRPTWVQLASDIARAGASDRIAIAKFDKTKNDLPISQESVNMFPTLKLYKAGDKANPVQYDDEDKSIEALTAWLHLHATHDFEVPAAVAEEGEEEAISADDDGGETVAAAAN